MNKLAAIAFVLFATLCFYAQADEDDFVRPGASDYPQLPAVGTSTKEFVPKSFTLVKQETGDLNFDRVNDVAMVIKGESKKFMNKNDSLGEPVYDTNPRVLVILFREGNGYRLAQQSNTFIIPPPSPVNSEPFQNITIRGGVLRLDLELWQSAGSWSMTSAAYKFRYADGDFVLIGADITDLKRNTGNLVTSSINFLTGKVVVSEGNVSSDRNTRVRSRNLKGKVRKTLRTFPVPFEWEVEKNLFL